jgi:non-lysosomal glucosylceramidase
MARRRTRPLLLGLLAVMTAMVHVSAHAAMPRTGARSQARAHRAGFFDIPEAAYRNALGNFPANAPCTPFDSGDPRCNAAGVSQPAPFANANPASQPGLGIPLGGVGAGSFMVNQAGSFGPWNFGGRQDQNYENRVVPQAAFHVREQHGSDAAVIRTLATESEPWGGLMPAWRDQLLHKGDANYAALYPFGWTTYNTFAADVSMRFWSPIVAGDDKRTSMPVAFFDIKVANNTARADKVSVMFTMPNVAEHIGGYWQFPAGNITPTVRKGLSSRFQRDPQTDVSAVTMSASHSENTLDAQDSEWTIAARPQPGQRVSWTTSWNGEGSGADVQEPFAASGALPNKAIDSSHTAGAIAVSVHLRPGESTVIPFALAWDFPRSTYPGDSSGEYWMRRYTAFLGARETTRNDYIPGSYPFHRGFEIADSLVADHDRALQAVQAWWQPIADSRAYPAWLKREALNELTQMVFNDSFWESGLITSVPSSTSRVGAAVPGTHLFCTSTGGGWGGCNEWDTDAYGYLAEGLLWPDLERDRLRGVLQQVGAGTSSGGVAGTATSGAPVDVGSTQFQDVPMKTIFRAYAYYKRTGDSAFLAYAYPYMLKLLQHLQAGIKPGDHLPPDLPGQSSTYDVVEVVGHGIYNSGLWLLTEEIMIEATERARVLGVTQATNSVRSHLLTELPLAKAEFEQLFWDPVGMHYKIDPVGSYGDGYFISAMFAQHVATTLGLAPLVDRQHELEHLRAAFPRLMQQRDSSGHLIGPPLVAPETGPPLPGPCAEICEVWPGSATFAAATWVGEGRRLGDASLVKEGLEMGHALEYQITENVSNGFLFNAPESWYGNDTHTYRSPGMNRTRAALDLLNSVTPVLASAAPLTPSLRVL